MTASESRGFIENLRHGELIKVNEIGEGYVEIFRLHNDYIVFEVHPHGGDDVLQGTWFYTRINEMIETIDSWT